MRFGNMNKFYTTFLFLLLFPVLLCAAVPPGLNNWTAERTQNETLTVSFSLPAGVFSYAGSTSVEIIPNGALEQVSAPEAVQKQDPLTGETVSVYPGPGKYSWVFNNLRSVPVTVTVRWQACSNDGECFLPVSAPLVKYDSEKDWHRDTPARTLLAPVASGDTGNGDENDFRMIPAYTILRSASGYMPPEEFTAFLQHGGGSSDLFRDKGTLAVMAIVLLGGLLLNLTPCVLPLIPVNLVMIGAGSSENDRSRRAKLGRGAVYGLGITVAYGVLGVIAVLTGTMFGSIAGSWVFNGITAVIFLLLALAMFGIFQFDLSRFGAKVRLPSGVKLGGVFLMGMLSATLAGACVAPVLAAVLIRAGSLYAAGNPAGLFLPFLLGLGMALPWPLAAAGVSLFPKAGAWMVRVKQFLGILILALAVYYGYQAYFQLRYAEKFEDGTDSQALSGLSAALTQAQKEKKLLLLDFGASWCKNCHAMEKNTFPAPQVREALANILVLRLAAEDPSEPETAELLKMFGVTGLPHYVLLTPETINEKRNGDAE